MKTRTNCVICKKVHPLMGKELRVCPDCIRRKEGLARARSVHRCSRKMFSCSNRQTLVFSRAARRFRERPNPPLVVASTLLVPGYVDEEKVGRIARFIAQYDPDIPYVLLGFAPNFMMPDLLSTSIRHAKVAPQAALDAGLRNVRIGNCHLLGNDY